MKFKKIEKKLVTVMMLVILVFMAGCGGKTPEESSTEKNTDVLESTELTCTISINCSTIFDNMDKLDSAKKKFVPENGWILEETTVSFEKGESVHDVLKHYNIVVKHV